MNTWGARRFVILNLGLWAAFLTLTGCRQAELMDPPPITLTSSQAVQTRQIILRGMATRGWTMKGEKPGEIVAEILVRNKHRATIGITYNQKQISFRYIDSQNLKYASDGGRRLIHKSYNVWVQNLRNDIMREITLLEATSPSPTSGGFKQPPPSTGSTSN